MTAITLNDIEFDYILRTEFAYAHTVAMPKYINQPPEIDTNIWSEKTTVITYELRVTDAQKWILDQILLNHVTIVLADPTLQTAYGYDFNSWLQSINAIYARSENDAYRWRITIEVILVSPHV